MAQPCTKFCNLFLTLGFFRLRFLDEALKEPDSLLQRAEFFAVLFVTASEVGDVLL